MYIFAAGCTSFLVLHCYCFAYLRWLNLCAHLHFLHYGMHTLLNFWLKLKPKKKKKKIPFPWLYMQAALSRDMLLKLRVLFLVKLSYHKSSTTRKKHGNWICYLAHRLMTFKLILGIHTQYLCSYLTKMF